MTVLDTTTMLVRKSTLAYIGALALSGDAVRESFGQLAQRGKRAERAALAQLRQLTGQARHAAGAPLADGQEQISEARSFLMQRRNRVLEAFGLPTQDGLRELNSQVERLSAAIDDLRTKSRRQKPEPLPGYDKMNVDTVLSQLPKLDEPALYAVQAYELTNQNRVTVLRAVDRTLTERLAPAQV